MRRPLLLLAVLLVSSVGQPGRAAQSDPAAGSAAAPPIDLTVEVEREAMVVRFVLQQQLPEAFLAALPTGAHVRVEYPVRVRSRRPLWWDRRIWRGEVVSTVAFDPVTGRYRCELLLDRVVVERQETSSADEALQWLAAPPAVRLALPTRRRRPRHLFVSVRAVYSSSTRWLLFPAVDGTEWVQLPVDGGE
jgi:hypothetical protein